MEPQTLVAFWQCERDDSSRVDITFVCMGPGFVVFFQK